MLGATVKLRREFKKDVGELPRRGDHRCVTCRDLAISPALRPCRQIIGNWQFFTPAAFVQIGSCA